jgi:hypothetical protein
MTSTLTEKAVVGRRIIHDHRSRKAKLPGIITRVDNTGQYPGVWVRLDGDRRNLFVPRKFFGRLTFLDEVTEVPALPMGRFQPTPDQLEGERDGVPVCTISEDGDLVLLTTDRTKAVAAATAYFTGVGLYDLDYVNFGALVLRWAVFEWEPEDADADWSVTWARESDDQAIHLYHLPA